MDRRTLLSGLTMAPFFLYPEKFAYSQSSLPRLAVANLEVFRVEVNKRGNWTIVRLNTS